MPSNAGGAFSAVSYGAALLLFAVTFPLVWVGSLVTTHQAGMSVPDWPSTYGYNLFLYPWQAWFYGPWDLFIEHGHRLLGATAGMAAINLLAMVYLSRSPAWLRVLAWGALLGVIAQGVLGGMRVVYDQRLLARIHACVGPAFLAYSAVLCAVTSRGWRTQRPSFPQARALLAFTLVTAGLAYSQILIGAQIRHVSSEASHHEFKLWIVVHLALAFALVAHALLAPFRPGAQYPGIRFASRALCLLACLQLGLGLTTWVVKFGFPTWLGEFAWNSGWTQQPEGYWQSHIVSAHVATGSLILCSAVLAALYAYRLAGATPLVDELSLRATPTLAEAQP